MTQLSSIKALIQAWPSRKVLADDIDVSVDRVNKWAQTQSIPARFHARILRAAQVRGIVVSAEDFTRLHDDVGAEDAA